MGKPEGSGAILLPGDHGLHNEISAAALDVGQMLP